MEHPAGQAASAAKPGGSNADMNDDNATAARPLPREEDTQGAPSSAAQPASQPQSFYGLSGGTSEEPGTLALSSAVGTGEIALPKVGSSAGKPAKQQELAIRRGVLNPLLDACTWDYATGAWLTPATEPDARLCGYPWQNMLKLPAGWTPTSFVPTFFHDEPDPNQRDKPRLDIVVSFDNGHSVRYHPNAFPIWSTSQQPTDAMQKRYNRAKQIGRHSNVD